MTLCNACDSFFRVAFVPSTQKHEYYWIRMQRPHLRPSELVASSFNCEICALLKFCSIRAFQEYLKDTTDGSFLEFTATSFGDGPISLALDCDNGLEKNLSARSKSIVARYPDDLLNSIEHENAADDIHLSVWATKDSPAALSKDVCDVPPIRQDGSSESFAVIRPWLSNCLDNHKYCSKTLAGEIVDEMISGALPTRVIDVMPFEGSSGVRLLETNGLYGHYVALSHCWGPQEKQPMRTTKANLREHLSGIAMDALPRTFSEAVEVTRAVGIKYLWIDSLCIVQDDTVDWEQEAKTMGKLFEKARFTIAATDATDSTKGLFLAGRCSTDPIIEVSYRPNGRESKGTISVSAGARHYYPFIDSPLGTRAWAFQERYLSRRMLHCTASGMLWYCKSQSTMYYRRYFTVDERGFKRFNDLIFEGSWQNDVDEYSRRLLTHESDRLIAIQGLATEIGKTRSDKYHMGVWMNELPFQLLWLRYRPSDSQNRCDDHQPHIPTWSWASLFGRKMFMERSSLMNSELLFYGVFLDIRGRQPMCKQLFAKTTAGKRGSLIVESYLKKASADKGSHATADLSDSDGASTDGANIEVDERPPFPIFDFFYRGAYAVTDDSGNTIGNATFDVAFTSEFYCLFLCNGEPLVDGSKDEWRCEHWFHYVLLLERTVGTSSFRRIGLGFITLQTWFEGEEVQKIRIV